ncbi:LysR family transcriptional regulator [Sphingomonas astaxanthinifaciens]|uniref:LysR family transcriptional regulator n=1 Tax=Sphingomonas astaxanthinifaciens DSM 22298 TaxID=1123267 RepID=A0ABQ5Z4A6_9SPHN|nr:LysR family transcriptional regulator [Sphingomonas astaxanthinifaciens]GLR47624.1 LysR family transcriptional regulator [Sphingomonas astaxanthinifaciens DSM 22298]
MTRDPEWSDWRVFLAVARHGSTLAAARVLHVSQSTAARRVTALEEALGVKLFERRALGYRLTEAGHDLMATAEEVEKAALAAEARARAHGRSVGGTVRITTEQVFAVSLVAPWLRDLHELHPEIGIELDSAKELRDLGAGEADVALRSTGKPQPEGVVGRALLRDDWTLYCSRDYAATHGVPASREDLLRHNIVGGGGGGLWRVYLAWLEELGLSQQVSIRYDSINGLMSAVKSAIGIAILPCVIADADPDLIRCLPPRTDHRRQLWLLTHERVRRTPAVRIVVDYLYERLSAHVRAVERRREELGLAERVAA